MRVSRYLKQVASFEKAQYDSEKNRVTDEYGAYIYSTPTTIKCRKVSETILIENGDGSVKTSQTTYYTDTLIQGGDKLDSKEVLKVSEMVDPFGKTQGYAVYL